MGKIVNDEEICLCFTELGVKFITTEKYLNNDDCFNVEEVMVFSRTEIDEDSTSTNYKLSSARRILFFPLILSEI